MFSSVFLVGLGRLAMIAALPLEAKRFTNSSNLYGPLKFKADGTFQISIFEDLHFGESMFPVSHRDKKSC